MAADDAEPAEILADCDTSVVSDALDEHGIDGVVTGLSPVHPEHAATGRARPMRFESVEGAERTNFPYAMLERLAAGVVFVLRGVPGLSCWGGVASRLAEDAGLAGVVVDGGYRDVPEIRRGTLPVFGASPTPRTSQRRARVASTDDPVTVDGVRVAPGDLVVADATGVVIVPAESEAAVARTASRILEEERALAAKVDRGAGVDELRDEDHEF